MPVIIGDVDVDMTDAHERAAVGLAPPGRPERLPPPRRSDVLEILRREQARLARLKAD